MHVVLVSKWEIKKKGQSFLLENIVIFHCHFSCIYISYICYCLDGLGTIAAQIVSLGEKSNANIYYQIVTTVDFNSKDSITLAAQNVLAYNNKRFLLLMRSYHTSKLISAVKDIKKDLDDVRWFVPILVSNSKLTNV